MKRFISIFMSLTMIFATFGAVNAEASTLQDMYYAYKYLIDSTAVEHKYDGVGSHYDLYDIDKDGNAELFIFSANYNDPYDEFSSLSVYTYKNGQAHLCKYFYGESWEYNTLCENRYGNGVGISGGTGGGYLFEFYILNGTELEATGNTYGVSDYYYLLHDYNGNRISEETANTYFPIRGSYGKDVSNLTYLKKYFKM